ncbi:MAG: hypothetical protein ABI693_28630 [Bryobacteraceae bacterium]
MLLAAAAFALLVAPPLPAADAALIVESYRIWRAVAERVWTGWSEFQPPIVYITAEYEYAIGFPRPLTGFEAQSSLAGSSVQARPRTLPPTLGASFPFEGTPAALLGTPAALESTPERWVFTAAHEMFHVYQANHGSYQKIATLKIAPVDDSSWQLNYPFPYPDLAVRNLVHLQGYLCYLAAKSTSSEDRTYHLSTEVEATASYAAYLAKSPEGEKAYHYSQFQEWNEGVAAYAEYRVAEEVSRLPGFERYRQVWEETYRDKPYLAKHAGRASQGRSMFYHLGLAKALALDKANPRWKERYFEPGVWLDDIIAASLPAADHK